MPFGSWEGYYYYGDCGSITGDCSNVNDFSGITYKGDPKDVRLDYFILAVPYKIGLWRENLAWFMTPGFCIIYWELSSSQSESSSPFFMKSFYKDFN